MSSYLVICLVYYTQFAIPTLSLHRREKWPWRIGIGIQSKSKRASSVFVDWSLSRPFYLPQPSETYGILRSRLFANLDLSMWEGGGIRSILTWGWRERKEGMIHSDQDSNWLGQGIGGRAIQKVPDNRTPSGICKNVVQNCSSYHLKSDGQLRDCKKWNIKQMPCYPVSY